MRLQAARKSFSAIRVVSAAQLCEEAGLRDAAAERYLALCVVPTNTPLPMSMLSRLWHVAEDEAEATAADFDAIVRLCSPLLLGLLALGSRMCQRFRLRVCAEVPLGGAGWRDSHRHCEIGS